MITFPRLKDADAHTFALPDLDNIQLDKSWLVPEQWYQTVLYSPDRLLQEMWLNPNATQNRVHRDTPFLLLNVSSA
jgi:hypothetical protein